MILFMVYQSCPDMAWDIGPAWDVGKKPWTPLGFLNLLETFFLANLFRTPTQMRKKPVASFAAGHWTEISRSFYFKTCDNVAYVPWFSTNFQVTLEFPLQNMLIFHGFSHEFSHLDCQGWHPVPAPTPPSHLLPAGGWSIATRGGNGMRFTPEMPMLGWLVMNYVMNMSFMGHFWRSFLEDIQTWFEQAGLVEMFLVMSGQTVNWACPSLVVPSGAQETGMWKAGAQQFDSQVLTWIIANRLEDERCGRDWRGPRWAALLHIRTCIPPDKGGTSAIWPTYLRRWRISRYMKQQPVSVFISNREGDIKPQRRLLVLLSSWTIHRVQDPVFRGAVPPISGLYNHIFRD